MFDRISWEVPHLSEQIFKIVIDFSTSNSSLNIGINANNMPQGEVNNPIEFEFNVNYAQLNNLNCNLEIDEILHYIDITNPNQNIIIELENGQHTWLLTCLDTTNTNINTSKSGSFSVNENFSVSNLKEVYLLYENSLVNKGNDIIINSQKNTGISIRIEKPSGQYSLETSGTSHTFTLDETILTEKGNYILNATFNRLEEPISIIKEFSVAQASMSFDKDEIEVGEEVKISVNIDSPVKKINSIIIDFGDGASNIDYFNIDENSKNIDFHHKYAQRGEYTVKLKTTINREYFEIEKNGISVEDTEDTEAPIVTLLEPENNKIIREDGITFSYKAEDNIKIDNCTFELYNYSGGFGTLDYTTTRTNIENNERIEVSLKDFQEGEYSWNVFCCDNSSNCNSDLEYDRDFTVSPSDNLTITTSNKEEEETQNTSDHEKKQEIEDLLAKIEDFLIKTESSTVEEKNILEDLEISTNLIYYKKRLIQMDQDLGNNLKFITDDLLREKRKSEILKELEDIKGKTPTNLEIINQHEYVKNSIAEDMENIIKEYMEAKKTNINKKSIKRLAELNYKIQNYITVTTNVRHVKITYSEKTEELTLITKKISLKNRTSERILEIIPKEIAENADEIIFITENKIIKEDPIFEISLDNLKDEKLVYYIERFIEPKEIEKTETILFKEAPLEGIGITGFFILDDSLNWSIYSVLIIILIIIVIFLVIIFINKIKIAKWKKEENVVKIFGLIKNCKRSLKIKDFNTAKEKYHKIKEFYPLIPEGCKKYLYKKIKEIRIEIDKKDIFDLVKEYEEAKNQGRKEDAQMIYKKIQSIYTRLPKKYRKKVYNMFRPQTPNF